MMGTPHDFTLDTDELDDVIAELERTETALEATTAELEMRMTTLHE